MGLFDALRGRRSDDAQAAPPSVSAPELEGDRAGSAVDNIASTSAANATSNAAGIELPTGERLYNPYEGLAAAVDGRGMRGQYRLPAQVREKFDCRERKSGQMRRFDAKEETPILRSAPPSFVLSVLDMYMRDTNVALVRFK